MARIRFVKPEFFTDGKLVRLRPIVRLFYIGLFTQADRAGRFIWNPADLNIKIIPYDRIIASHCLEDLMKAGRIIRYGETGDYGYIVNFLKHQYINPREPESKIPAPTREDLKVLYQYDTGILDKGIRIKDKGEKREEKNSLSYLEKIPEKDAENFMSRFEMSKKQLLSKAESFLLYCKSKGKKYDDYHAALLNAIKRDFPERGINAPPVRSRIVERNGQRFAMVEEIKKLETNMKIEHENIK